MSLDSKALDIEKYPYYVANGTLVKVDEKRVFYFLN